MTELNIPKPDIDWAHDSGTNIELWLDATMPQGSDVWLEWRKQCGGTATQANVVSMNPLTYSGTPQTWADQRAGVGSEISEQGRIAMAHGAAHEDRARELCNVDTPVRNQFEPVCIKTSFDNNEWNIGASLDGFRLNPDTNTLQYLEIKCPYTGARSATFKEAENNQIPDHYIWQMAHQALTLGAHIDPAKVQGYFVVYLPADMNPYMPSEYVKYLHVSSESLMERMEILLDLWPKYIHGEMQPGDLRGIGSRDLDMAVQSYIEAHRAKTEASKEEARAKKAILQAAFEHNGVNDPENPPPWVKRIHLDGITITRTARNTVNWSQLAKDNQNIDITPYESVSESWRVTVKKEG